MTRSRRVLHAFLAMAIVTGLWYLTVRLTGEVEQHRLPPGWTVIRPPSEVCTMTFVGDTLWTGGKDGLIVIDRHTLQQIPPPPDTAPLPRIWALLSDRQKRVWVGHDGGLALWSEGRWQTVEPPGLRRVLSLAETADGTILAGGESGVAHLSTDGWRLLPIPEGFRLPSFDVIFVGGDSTLWLGSSDPTRGGLVSFDGSSWRRYAVPAPLPHPSVNTIVQDHRGAIWIGTGFANRGGAARFSGGQWTSLSEEDGLAGPKVRSIFPDRQDRLWFGSEYDGVAILEADGRWDSIRPGAGLAGREVKVMLEDEDGYWLGTDQGLSHFRRGAR